MENRSDRFCASDVTATKAQCHFCERYVRGTLTCVLYTHGIPQSILLNEVDHFAENFPGDGGALGLTTLGRLPVLQDLISTLASYDTPERVAARFAKSFETRSGKTGGDVA